jgi:hypothetical protein
MCRVGPVRDNRDRLRCAARSATQAAGDALGDMSSFCTGGAHDFDIRENFVGTPNSKCAPATTRRFPLLIRGIHACHRDLLESPIAGPPLMRMLHHGSRHDCKRHHDRIRHPRRSAGRNRGLQARYFIRGVDRNPGLEALSGSLGNQRPDDREVFRRERTRRISNRGHGRKERNNCGAQ